MSVDLMKTVTYETAGAEGNRNPSSANGARRRTEVPPGPFTDPEMPLINVSVRQGVVYDTDARAPAARRPSPFSNGAVRRQIVAAPRFTQNFEYLTSHGFHNNIILFIDLVYKR